MKRWAIRVFVFLLLGAIVNVSVVVAMVLLMRKPSSRANTTMEQAQLTFATPDQKEIRWQVATWRSPGKVVVSSYRGRRSGGTFKEPDVGTIRLPVWGQSAKEPLSEFTAGQTDFEQVVLVGRGWPCITLWHLHYRVDEVPSRQAWHVRGALEFGDPWDNPQVLPRELPCWPAWPGFAINTLFYAAILWGVCLLFTAPFALRRRRRIKRGLCVKCGYDLRGSRHRVNNSSVCPECGAAVTPELLHHSG